MNENRKKACSLTIIISALNEEKLIAKTVSDILSVARENIDQYEMILVNDGSTDRTGEIMESFSKVNSEIEVINNPEPRGLGKHFQEGINKASCEYIIHLSGDNELTVDGFKNLINAIGSTDLVIGYRVNAFEARILFRAVLSYMFTRIINLIFGFKLKDVHGLVVFPLEIVRKFDLQLVGYTQQVELLVKLFREKASYVEVPMRINKETQENSQALNFKTLVEFTKIILHLIFTKTSKNKLN